LKNYKEGGERGWWWAKSYETIYKFVTPGFYVPSIYYFFISFMELSGKRKNLLSNNF
jgi:hypothetical protein